MRKLILFISRLMFKWVNFEDNYGRDTVVRFFQEHRSSPCRVLDLGAGEGKDLLNIRSVQPDAELLAIENWPPNQAFLKENHILVSETDIEKMPLPYADESIDIVICNQILEHTKEIFWILHEITRVLKKNGSVIIGVPNMAAFHNRLILMMGLTPECIALRSAHIRGFTFNDLNSLMHVFPGYNLKNRKGVGFYPFPRGAARFFSGLFPSLAWGIFVCYQKTADYHDEFLAEGARFTSTNYYLGNYHRPENQDRTH